MSEQLSRRSGAFASSPPSPKRIWEGTDEYRKLCEMRDITLLLHSKGVGGECADLLSIIEKMLTAGGKSQDAYDVVRKGVAEDGYDLAKYLARRVGAHRILDDQSLYDCAVATFGGSKPETFKPATPEPKKSRGNSAAFDMETPPSRWQGALM